MNCIFKSVFIPKVASLLQNRLNDLVKGDMNLSNKEIITNTGEGGLEMNAQCTSYEALYQS